VVARFSTLVEPMVRGVISESISVDSPLRVLDVGCGAGEYLRAISSLNPQASGVGLEIDPAVAGRAAHNLAEWGIDSSFEIVCGDVLSDDSQLDGSFDLITLLNVVYYFTEEQRPTLFRVIGELLSPGGKLVLVNMTLGEKFGSGIYDLLYRISPKLMGGCRGIRLSEKLREHGFQIKLREYHQQLLFPSEVILARKLPVSAHPKNKIL